MRADIVWWDLSASGQTIESMREYLRNESVAAFAEVPGLRFKMWVSDPVANRWGAVLLWESEEASRYRPWRLSSRSGSPSFRPQPPPGQPAPARPGPAAG